MAIEAIVAALDTRLDPAEAAIAERMLREYGGTIPDNQLIEEIGLALAVWRRTTGARSQVRVPSSLP
jgi:hypothetical protein